jgi:3-methyladenine DNA glycosylase AlkC
MPARPAPKPKPDNPRAFKHAVGAAAAQRLAEDLLRAYPAFDARGFVRDAKRGLPPLELKPRIRFLCDAMASRLPSDYPAALHIVLATLGPELGDGGGVSANPFHYWIHASFVEVYGLAHLNASLAAMREITKRSTSEFAVRPFLERDLARVLAFLTECATDSNPHVRRWASEGSRPFLPWGKGVPALRGATLPSLPLLERLCADPSLYVRTSVANHLNDISKLQPELAVQTAQRWLDAGVPEAAWIAKRALRGLIKAGHHGALGVFGVRPNARVKLLRLGITQKRVRVGEHLEFAIDLEGAVREELVIDYALTFPGAREKMSRKVFKLTQRGIEKGERLSLRKRHSFRPITTRTYRAGEHGLELLVNGKLVAQATFQLAL